MNNIPSSFLSKLSDRLSPDQIITDITRRRAHATDASFYQLIPELVLKLNTLSEVQDCLRLANELDVSITFRAAGTSLSGQAITDSVLIILSEQWRGHEILDDGEHIRLQPGVIGGQANAYLKPFHKKIGPDPASINACKIGGIVANNASGMCCGVSQNTYHTLQAMTFVLADGTLVDTSDTESVATFRRSHSELLEQLHLLGSEVKDNAELTALIEKKYRLKNTTGYAINSLLDYEDPLDILLHLMVGSEGTLGFIGDVTYRTVADYPHKASGMFLFSDPMQAAQLVEKMSDVSVSAVELLDQRALNSVKGMSGLPDSFCHNDDACTALLIETRSPDADALQRQMTQLNELITHYNPIQSIELGTHSCRNDKLWAIRKATFPAVGAVREPGTTVIIEDVAFPLEKLGQGILALHALFDRYGYQEAIIFGHALAGNLHFVFTQSFDAPESVARYDEFMQAVSQLVAVDYKGSLKAEHGTGRNMAPFVELEWGATAYQIMQRLKSIIDPRGILNPGVILNDDKEAHIKDLKPLPLANDIVDKCIECGFCEPVCPSKDLTLTPRQRISLWRRIQQLRGQPSLTKEEQQELQDLQRDYQHHGVDTCAATGMCAEKCPVNINTGDLVRELRSENVSRVGQLIARTTANHFAVTSQIAGMGLAAAATTSRIIGSTATDSVGAMVHNASGKRAPLWHSHWPKRSHFRVNKKDRDDLKPVLFFASCGARTMGPGAHSSENRSLLSVAQSVFRKAGYQLIHPDEQSELCCGMPYASKGLSKLADYKAQQLVEAFQDATGTENIPIVFDTSPCRYQIDRTHPEVQAYELFQFVRESILEKLTITPTEEVIALHVTCSTRKMGLAANLRAVAQACARQVVEPKDIECCGFAGDKGFFLPELNNSALATLSASLPAQCSQGYSNSRTCEIGLSRVSGIEYKSLMYLLDEVSVSAS